MGKDQLFSTFGQWLKTARQGRGLTQIELARRMGYEVSLVRKVEAGQRHPSLEFRERLADALGDPLVTVPDPALLSLTNVYIPHDNGSIPDPGSLFAGSYLPLRPNPLFTGRTDLLQKLAQAFTTRRTICVGQIAAATGLGGIGKTQLAVEFAHRYGRFFPGGVFWLNFADAAAIPTEIARCGHMAHLNLSPDYDQLPQEQQVTLVQRAWQENIPRLLIFDNCEEESLLDQWRPTTGGCHVLVTSRCQRWDPILNVTHLFVDTLPRSESKSFLRQFIPTLTDQEANAIAEALGDLPLALHLAGSYLALDEATLSPQAYLQQLGTQGRLQHQSLQTGHLSPTRHENNLTRTFALSIQRLHNDQPVDRLALELLWRAVHFAPGQPIPLTLLSVTVPDSDQVKTATTRLVQTGLVTTGADDTIRVHQLIVEFVLGLKNGEDRDAAAKAVALTLLRLATQNDVTSNPYPVREWQVHLRYVTDNSLKHNTDISAALCQAFGWHLTLCGDYKEACHYLETALTIQRQTLSLNHPDLAVTLNSLGRTWQALSQYGKARIYHEEALAIRKQLFGDQNPMTAESHNSLGMVHQLLGDYPAARHHFETALASRRELLGPTHTDTGFSYLCLAIQCNHEGEYRQAIEWAEKALDISRTNYGDTHADTARIMNGLGMFYYYLGEYPMARYYYEHALETRTQLLGREHNDTLTTQSNLGCLLRDMGHIVEARKLNDTVLSIREKHFGPFHYATAQSLQISSTLWLETGAYEKALICLERTLHIYETVFGPTHVQTATPLTSLGYLHHRLGNWSQAFEYLQRALALRREKLGEQHLHTAITLTHLGDLYTEMGEYAAASTHLTQAYNSLIHFPNPNLRVLSQNYYAQGRLAEMTGNTAQAQHFYEEALVLQREYLGLDHPYTQQSQQALNSLHSPSQTGHLVS